MQNNDSLRKRIKRQRSALSGNQQQIAAQKLTLRIARHPLFRQAQTIAVYWASNGEISLKPLIKIAQSLGKQCLLPVLDDQSLTFAAFNRNTKMRKNRYGLWEPLMPKQSSPENIDLILCPLVAFDSRGNRIGMGGGFYDRTFAKIKRQKKRFWGVAHALQEEQRLMTDWWDVKLDGVFTDKRVHNAYYRFSPDTK